MLGLVLASASLTAQAADGVLKKATFCHSFKEDSNAPKDVAESFQPDETVNLSIELEGRPKSGVVAAKFLFRDELIAETTVDVATANKGVIFSFGENTFVRFTVTHKNPLPVSAAYSAVVTFDDKPLGTFPFTVAPPEGSLPSKVLKVALAKGADEDYNPVGETREFESSDKVYLLGVGSLGLSSWLEAIWKVGGKEDDEGYRTITMKENKDKVPFSFAFVPAGGWPAGTHEVLLNLNGEVVAKEKFTVKVGAPMPAGKLVIESSQLFQDDGNGDAGKEVKGFTVADKAMHACWNLKEKVLVKGVQFDWVLVEAGEEKMQILVTADVEPGVNNQITSSLTAKNGLPAGKYRIDLVQDGKIIDTKPFEIK